METQKLVIENSSVAVTTLNATQIAKADYFGYSSVKSKENSKVQNFAFSDVSTSEKRASWTISHNGKIDSYVVNYSRNEDYQHGTIGRYLQSLESFSVNTFLHSFGNSPVLSLIDVANVFNVPLALLNIERCTELASAIVDFSELNTDSTNDVRSYIATLEQFGLVVDESNTFASKIQSLTSLQKNYVYYKDKTSSRTLKLEWDKEQGLDLVLSLKFENDSDKKSYGFELRNIVTDCQAKVSKDKVKFLIMSKAERKQTTLNCMQASLQNYKGTSINMKLEVISNKIDSDFDLDSLFE